MPGYTKKALTKIILFLREEIKDKNYYNDDVEILFNDHFETDFTENYEYPRGSFVSENISENFFNDKESFRELLKEEGHGEIGIYEIMGEYWEEWVEGCYEYPNEMNCYWELRETVIHKLTRYETKKYMEGRYKYEDMANTMHMIEELGLDKDLNNIRSSGCIQSNNLFLYTKEEKLPKKLKTVEIK